MTKLSIIIPVYNAAPGNYSEFSPYRTYLTRCLDSIHIPEEYLHDVEVIAIDDGSTDASAGILDEERDRVGFKIIHHATNWGVAMTRNHGISLASGEWVTFLDADDELTPDAIETMLKYIDDVKANDRNVIQFNHLRQHGNAAPVMKFSNRAGNYYARAMPERWVYCWNKIYKKAFLDANGIRFPIGLDYGEDELFVLNCFRANRWIYHANESTVIKHFDNDQSLTKTLTPQRLNNLIRAELDLLEQKDNPEEFTALLRQVIRDHFDSGAFIRIYGRL